MWLINWKRNFLEWITRSFVLKFFTKIAFSCFGISKFSGLQCAHTPSPRHRKRAPTATCWYSRLLYSNLLATSIFIETTLVTLTNYFVCGVFTYSGIHLRDLKHQRRRLQKRHFTIRTVLIKLYCVYSTSFNSTKNGKSLCSWILKNCIKVQEKKKKIVVLRSRPPQNVKIGSITS